MKNKTQLRLKGRIPTANKARKIRSYNYNTKTVYDHRTGKKYDLEMILDGKLELIITDLLIGVSNVSMRVV